jgi:hypothetical protein
MHAHHRRQQQARCCVGNEWTWSCGMLDGSDLARRMGVCQYKATVCIKIAGVSCLGVASMWAIQPLVIITVRSLIACLCE